MHKRKYWDLYVDGSYSPGFPTGYRGRSFTGPNETVPHDPNCQSVRTVEGEEVIYTTEERREMSAMLKRERNRNIAECSAVHPLARVAAAARIAAE